VTDHAGNRFIATSVTLAQPGDEHMPTGQYAEWMPYQQGQAAKADAPAIAPAADALIASAGYHADQADEAEIAAAGLTAPRVTAEQVQALMDKLTWRYEQPEGTTSTFAHAYLGRFYLTTGHSACVSPENFNAALGQKYACEQAEGKARDKLWELEGWLLHRSLTAGA
jgi:hypothetical protein